MSATATVEIFNGGERHYVTGRVKKEYKKGLTVEDERGVIYYADFERVEKHVELRALLW